MSKNQENIQKLLDDLTNLQIQIASDKTLPDKLKTNLGDKISQMRKMLEIYMS